MSDIFDRDRSGRGQGRSNGPSIGTVPKIIIGVVIAVIIGAVAYYALSIVNVDPGYAGVAFDKVSRTFDPVALQPGWNHVSPLTTQVYTMETWVQKEEVDASASTTDIQRATTKVALNYHIEAADVPWVFEHLGPDYKSRNVDPAIQETVKAITAKYTAPELVNKRELVRTDIENLFKDKFTPLRIKVDAVSITNFEFDPDYQKSVEEKQTAQQNALKAAYDLQRVQVEANQTVAKAQAEAEAINVKGKALRDNPQLVQLQWVTQWNGVLPQYLITSGSETGQLPGMFLNLPATQTAAQTSK